MSRRTLPVLAATAYAANCSLGIGVAARVIDTHRIRWVHHALFSATAALTGGALIAALGERRTREALALSGAATILAAIPYIGTRTWRHSATAVAAAPFFAAALVTTRNKKRG